MDGGGGGGGGVKIDSTITNTHNYEYDGSGRFMVDTTVIQSPLNVLTELFLFP